MKQDYSTKTALLVYDGECPVCRNYVKYIRISELVDQFTLINGRENHPVIEEINQRNIDLNEGIVLKLDDVYYHGDEAMHVLALISSRSGLFNKINHAIFKSPRMSKLLYPLMRGGRNCLLKILRIDKI